MGKMLHRHLYSGWAELCKIETGKRFYSSTLILSLDTKIKSYSFTLSTEEDRREMSVRSRNLLPGPNTAPWCWALAATLLRAAQL